MVVGGDSLVFGKTVESTDSLETDSDKEFPGGSSIGGKVAGVMATFWDKMPDKRIFFGIIAVAAFIGGILIFMKVKSLDKIVKDKTWQ